MSDVFFRGIDNSSCYDIQYIEWSSSREGTQWLSWINKKAKKKQNKNKNKKQKLVMFYVITTAEDKEAKT